MSFKHYLIKIGIYATQIICIKSPNKIGFIGVLITLCGLIFVLLAATVHPRGSSSLLLAAILVSSKLLSSDTATGCCSGKGREADTDGREQPKRDRDAPLHVQGPAAATSTCGHRHKNSPAVL